MSAGSWCVKALMSIGLVCIGASSSWAQRYPAKVVRLLVPFSPGSGSDTLGRIIAGGLTDVFGQQVIVDNRAGAAGNIGAEIAAKAPPDGYTLLLANLGHAANVSLYRNLRNDVVRDFAPGTQLCFGAAIVVAASVLPVQVARLLVKLAKRSRARSIMRRGGVGTPTFVATECSRRRPASISCTCRTGAAAKR